MSRQPLCIQVAETTLYRVHHRRSIWKIMQCNMALVIFSISVMMDIQERTLLGLDSDTFYIYHVTAVMVDNLRRLLLGINLSDKAIMDFDFPGVGFPV